VAAGAGLSSLILSPSWLESDSIDYALHFEFLVGSILGCTLSELRPVALHTAARDVGWHVVTPTLIGGAVVEGALSYF